MNRATRHDPSPAGAATSRPTTHSVQNHDTCREDRPRSAFSPTDRLVTGLSGLVSVLLSLVMFVLYFVYPGPPPLANVLCRNLITVAVLTGFLIFAVGLARLLRAGRGGDPGLSGSVAVTALLSYVAVTLVSASLETGTSLWHPDGSLDPTVDGPLSAAAVLLHGPITRALLATFLFALAIATRHGLLPGWVRTGSSVVGLLNLAMVPSLFFGMDAAFIYAANGWGSVALMGLIDFGWFALLSAAVLRTRPVRIPSVTANEVRAPRR